jgi:hypothetical protein
MNLTPNDLEKHLAELVPAGMMGQVSPDKMQECLRGACNALSDDRAKGPQR